MAPIHLSSTPEAAPAHTPDTSSKPQSVPPQMARCQLPSRSHSSTPASCPLEGHGALPYFSTRSQPVRIGDCDFRPGLTSPPDDCAQTPAACRKTQSPIKKYVLDTKRSPQPLWCILTIRPVRAAARAPVRPRVRQGCHPRTCQALHVRLRRSEGPDHQAAPSPPFLMTPRGSSPSLLRIPVSLEELRADIGQNPQAH